MSGPEILLHIGTTKTGTTSIQRAFSSAPAVGLGVLYPRTGLGRGGAHHNLAYELGAQFRARGRFAPSAGTWDEVLHEIATTGETKAVISSEAFSFLNAQEVKALADRLRGWPVRVILYLRRPDAWIHSGFVQHAKFGLTDLSPDTYLSGFPSLSARRWQALSQLEIYQAWSQAFGGDRTDLFLYQRQSIGDNVVRHFADVCGVDPARLPKLEMRANVKVPLKALVAATIVRSRCAERLGPKEFALSPASAAKISQFFAHRADFVRSYSLFSVEHARLVLSLCASDTEQLFILLGPRAQRFADLSETDYRDFVADALSLAPRLDEEEWRFIGRITDAIIRWVPKAG